MDTIFWIFISTVAISVAILAILYRHQVAAGFCVVGRFFRAAVNPPYNNWMWLGCWAVTIILFIVAAKVGGGEPFGLEALRKATEGSPDPVEQFYHRSHGINQPPAARVTPPPPDRGSWIWWKLAVGMLFFSIAFTPIAFHDEVGAAWNRAWERWEQRRRRIRLQPHPQQPPPASPAVGQPSVTQTIGGTLWARIKRRITEQLPGEWVGEFTYNAAERILRSIFRF